MLAIISSVPCLNDAWQWKFPDRFCPGRKTATKVISLIVVTATVSGEFRGAPWNNQSRSKEVILY